MINLMTKYSFILLNGDQDALLERIQEMGLVDIKRNTKALDSEAQKIVTYIELINGLVKGLQKIEVPEGIQPKHLNDTELDRLAGGLLMYYSDASSELQYLRKELEARRIWGSFEPEILKELSEAGVPIHFHRLSNKLFKPEWEQEYALSVVQKEKNNTWFLVIGEDNLPGEIPTPESDAAQLEQTIKEKEQDFRRLLTIVAGAQERIPEMIEYKDELCSQLDLYLAGKSAVPAAENTIVTLVGYAPVEDDDVICAALDATDVFYIKEKAVLEDNPPIKLKNNWFVKQFEVLTDMYGRPAYNGFDPTPFISVFFLLFFAFCMGDCGYGLILIAIGILLKKVDSFKDLAPLVVILGIGTTVIGFLFHTFFSIDIANWEIFKPIKGIFLPAKIGGYDGTMVLALLIGIVHLCLAMCVKTWNETRNKGFINSLGTWGWTLLIVGGTVVATLFLMGVLDKGLTKLIVIVMGVLSALGIFVFNDMKRSKLANVGVGLWNTYNTVTGLLGDVLSYLRLYALGLAGAMLGMAFNNIGTMVLGDGKSALLWIPFVLIVIIGHTLNVAMCALGAFVHPLRLNFLEFFKNSGYEANGRNFHPLSK